MRCGGPFIIVGTVIAGSKSPQNDFIEGDGGVGVFIFDRRVFSIWKIHLQPRFAFYRTVVVVRLYI